MLFLVSAPARALEAGVDLLGHKTVAWSSSTMFDCKAEGVALALAVAEVVPGARMAVGCSCRPGMTPANLASEPKWWPTSKTVVATTRCD